MLCCVAGHALRRRATALLTAISNGQEVSQTTSYCVISLFQILAVTLLASCIVVSNMWSWGVVFLAVSWSFVMLCIDIARVRHCTPRCGHPPACAGHEVVLVAACAVLLHEAAHVCMSPLSLPVSCSHHDLRVLHAHRLSVATTYPAAPCCGASEGRWRRL